MAVFDEIKDGFDDALDFEKGNVVIQPAKLAIATYYDH